MPKKIQSLLLLSAVAVAAWSPASFAQQVVNGAIPTALGPVGVTNGVAMTGQGGGGTLIVGTVGGPDMDIFTNNSAGGIVTNPLLQAVSTDASSESNIAFNSSSNVFGTIGVTQPGGPFFLNINGGNDGTVVNFMGNVYATITTVNQTGTLNFNSGSTNISATNFAGDGTISLAPNTTLIGALTTNTADTGTLSLGGASVLNGAVGGATGLKTISVVGGSNTAGVAATITGAVDAYSFNLGTNTLNIGGALTIANLGPAGVINTTLASPTVYGNIRPVGATNLGPTLGIDVSVPQTAFLPVGTVFDIVQTQAGTLQSGTNGSVLVIVKDPTNPLYTFSAVPLAGTVNGLVAIEVTGIPLLVPVAPAPPVPIPPPVVPIVPIAAPVVPAVLGAAAVAPATSDLITTVLPAINALADPAAVVLAVAQLAPSAPDLAAPLVTFQGTQQFQNLWSSHLDESRCGDSGADDQRRPDGQPRFNETSSACPDYDARDGLWLKAFGYFANQDAEGAFLGYSSKSYGAMVGFDMPIDDGTRAGIGVGYARNTIDGKMFTADTDFNTYQATAYVAHESGPMYVEGDVSFGLNQYTGSRQIVFPGIDRTADANYNGKDITAYIATGYHFFSDGFMITPIASLQFTNLGLNGYTETGAGDIDLRVNSQNYNFLESGLGVKFARAFDMGDATNLLPEMHFKWLYEIINPAMQNTAALDVAGSPSFTTPGFTPDNSTFDLGAGVSLLSCVCSGKPWTVSAVYDHYWRPDEDYTANQVMVKVSDRF
jgi:uncharacterized protein with beta-barrel porin domain